VYSDGLASVSVFIERSGDPVPVAAGYSSLGAINTYSTLRGGYQITVVGEVPASTVRQIAASVSPLGTAP
jgi:sigma-E factor negative regulatory protein RseB